MIFVICKVGDKIILLWNVYKFVINVLVLCGVIFIYIEMSVDFKIGIVLGFENDWVV